MPMEKQDETKEENELPPVQDEDREFHLELLAEMRF